MIQQQKQICNIYQVESKKFSSRTLDFIKSNVPQVKDYLLFPMVNLMGQPKNEDHYMIMSLFQILLSAGYTHFMITL